MIFWFTGALVTTLLGYYLLTQENPNHSPHLLYAQFVSLIFFSVLFWPLLLLSLIHHMTKDSK